MKVGDYVRFKTLSREIKIGKIIEVIEPDNSNEFSPKKCNVYDLDNNEATVDDHIIKSSPNIIDLIEVGDYVNGYRVVWKDINAKEIGINAYCKDERLIQNTNQIKLIVTKEQFEAIKYEIK